MCGPANSRLAPIAVTLFQTDVACGTIKPLIDAALTGDAIPAQTADDGHGHAPGETH